MYPQPQAYLQQKLSYLDLMKLLLAKGADVNARVTKKVWFTSFNTDLSGVDEIGATAFWRAAYASDVEAMRLLVAYGADPNIPTMRPAGRPRPADSQREDGRRRLRAAAGTGRWPRRAAAAGRRRRRLRRRLRRQLASLRADRIPARRSNTSSTSSAPTSTRSITTATPRFIMPPRAATPRASCSWCRRAPTSRALNREGQTTADMANAPTQRVQPFPETLATAGQARRQEQSQVRLLLIASGSTPHTRHTARIALTRRAAAHSIRLV